MCFVVLVTTSVPRMGAPARTCVESRYNQAESSPGCSGYAYRDEEQPPAASITVAAMTPVRKRRRRSALVRLRHVMSNLTFVARAGIPAARKPG